MKKRNLFFPLVYAILFLLGIKALFHGFPDIERFFAEWWDERLTLTYIMKFGTFNFSPTMIMHPPLYHYLTFIPIGIFYVLGKLLGFFHDKIDFARFYFNDTQYFFLIGRAMSYIFYWLAAMVVYKISRLFFNRLVSHLTALAYILIPQFIVEYSTTRPETLLFLNTAIFFYFYLKFYLDNKRAAYLYIASFFLGVSAATKYNALFLGVIFIPLLIYSRKDIFGKNRNKVIPVCLRVGLLVFLGFVLCDPFFVIEFKKFFSNFMALTKDLRQYTAAPGVINIFGHLRELASPAYLNPAGFLVFILGLWALFFRKRILFFASLPALVLFEAYFGINQLAPLRYFNPLMPIAALIFGWGVNLILEKKKFFISILVIFFLLEGYNCFRVWQALSFKPSFTHGNSC